ncbi:MAG: hypothetical protein J6R88_06350 [Clostridia bacterium]|nr:hypothetical protein [Clostridia bacterium]
MDKFGLFDFISKLSTNKEAQNSISNILNKVFSSANESANKTENVSKTFNESSDVYRSPSSYSLYNDMMKKHDEISKNIPNSNKT